MNTAAATLVEAGRGRPRLSPPRLFGVFTMKISPVFLTLCRWAACLSRRPEQWRSLCPAIDRSWIRRLPLLESTRDEHRACAVGPERDVGDVRRRHIDGAHELPVAAHHEHPARTVLRIVVVAVGTELDAVRTVVGILVRRGWRKILQARPNGAQPQLAVGTDWKIEHTTGQHLRDQQMLLILRQGESIR